MPIIRPTPVWGTHSGKIIMSSTMSSRKIIALAFDDLSVCSSKMTVQQTQLHSGHKLIKHTIVRPRKTETKWWNHAPCLHLRKNICWLHENFDFFLILCSDGESKWTWTCLNFDNIPLKKHSACLSETYNYYNTNISARNVKGSSTE